jgi:hypothetical protein
MHGFEVSCEVSGLGKCLVTHWTFLAPRFEMNAFYVRSKNILIIETSVAQVAFVQLLSIVHGQKMGGEMRFLNK